MSQLQPLREVHTEPASFNELVTRINGLPVEPRCRVCRNDEIRRKVNDFLAGGASYAMVLRALEQDNAGLEKHDRVTIDSIRHHTTRQFPVQNIAKATYREILERRAQENGVDFINGVAIAITPMAFFETVMAKGYETLVHPDTKVDVSTGMIAAARLQALIESRAAGTTMVDMLVKRDHIINSIKSTLPEEMWEEIARKLDEPIAVGPPTDELEERDDADDEYDAVNPAMGRIKFENSDMHPSRLPSAQSSLLPRFG